MPDTRDATMTLLRGACVDLAGVLEAALSAEVFGHTFRRRIETVAQRLALQREALAHASVLLERVLAR